MIKTATNKQTGERLAYIDGQWVPVEQSATNDDGRKAYKIGGKWVVDDERQEPSVVDQAKNVALQFASGANRNIAGAVDMVPNAVNAAAEMVGSTTRMPSLEEWMSNQGMTSDYMQPGLARDVVTATGEAIPTMMAIGQVPRSMAQQLPKFAPGETVTRGIVRDMGKTTARQDALVGASAAAGAEVGEEFGGDVGAQFGAVAALLAAGGAYAGVRSMLDNILAGRAVSQAAPSIDQIKAQARAAFKEVDDDGATIAQEPLDALRQRITARAQREGFNPRLNPKTSAVLDEIGGLAENPMALSELEIMRRVARMAASDVDAQGKPTPDGRLGTIIVGMIDDFVEKLPANQLSSGGRGAADLLKRGRTLWGKARRAEMIEEAVYKAQQQASGFENGIRVQFRSILNNPKKRKAFTPEEVKAMQRVVRGGPAENIAKHLGKFGFTEGQAGSMLLSSLGVAGGAAAAGPVGAVAVPVIGQTMRKTAQMLTKRNARLADELVRAGKDGRKVAMAYIRNTPKKDRKVEELTSLLMQDGVILPSTKTTNQLVSDAVYFASVLREGLEDTEEATTQ